MVSEAQIEFATCHTLTSGQLREATSTCGPFLVRSGVSVFVAGRASTVLEIGALSDLDKPASHVQNHSDIRELKIRGCVAVTQAENASTEDLFVVASRPLDACDGEKMRDADPLARGHLIALLFDLYAAH